MSSPFEVLEADYTVLRNDEGQHSLWPSFADVPDGWAVVHGPARRPECMSYIQENWTDLRPSSVAAFVAEHAGER